MNNPIIPQAYHIYIYINPPPHNCLVLEECTAVVSFFLRKGEEEDSV